MRQLRSKVAGGAEAVAGVAALVASLLTSGGTAASAGATSARTGGQGASSAAKPFSNPVLGPGQDPSVLTDQGWYCFPQTSPDSKTITIRRSRSIKSLAAAPKT